ncbi:hypothetical protein [Streptomyces ambofaciens]|uniref:hypothetical protein n=1 Tax=Streptomyces ambofaciens TaxID=1889 RepID=UPI000A6166DF|nr:hypothetical protein [Streptomyces ambofaciens]
MRTSGPAAPEPVVPQLESFEARHDIVRVHDEAVTPPGRHRDAGAGNPQQFAPTTADEVMGLISDNERGTPRLGIDGVMPVGDSGSSPTGLPVPAIVWVIHPWNGRERHQVPGEGCSALGAIEDGHTLGSTVGRAGTSKDIQA